MDNSAFGGAFAASFLGYLFETLLMVDFGAKVGNKKPAGAFAVAFVAVAVAEVGFAAIAAVAWASAAYFVAYLAAFVPAAQEPLLVMVVGEVIGVASFEAAVAA